MKIKKEKQKKDLESKNGKPKLDRFMLKNQRKCNRNNYLRK
jgi:hypothetical protein